MGVGVIFRHLDEIYKRRLLDAHVPRRGDFAEIVREHCTTDIHGHSSRETGMKVRVVNDPHECTILCANCGQEMHLYCVEIVPSEPQKIPGPFFYPLKWLRRLNRVAA